MKIRLVALDEHVLLRLGLARVVAGSGDIDLVGDAGTAAEGRDLVRRLSPDVITFDVALSGADAFGYARELRALAPDLGLVLLSAVNDDTLLYRALDEGLSAYVAKASPAQTVLGAIRHAAVAPDSFTAPGLSAALARRRAANGLLSQREREVLALMRDGISLPGIAVRLQVSEATVKTYVARLYSKLHVKNRSQALMAAVNQGLLSSVDAA
jgi:DNA-binding NarL/FixJ family response regulator